MNVRPMPGSVPRNGLPPSRDYVYNGLGFDQYDPRQVRQATRTGKVPSGFKPYVYGATLGQPSAARPDRVAAGIAAGITETAQRPRPERPTAPVVAEPAPAVEPERCEACGYLVTAPGHTIICGGDE